MKSTQTLNLNLPAKNGIIENLIFEQKLGFCHSVHQQRLCFEQTGGIRRSTLASKLLRCKSGKIFVLWSWGTLKALRTIISYWVDARIDWRIIIIIITIFLQLLSEAFKIGYAADDNVS